MKNNHFTEEKRTAFHELMIDVQSASDGMLPHSIVHFMEEALEPDTKSALLQMHSTGKINAEQIAKVMYDAGYKVDHGSIEPVDEYIRRKLI